MSTLIESLYGDISNKAGTLIWSAALVAALGDPKEWEYRGECGQDSSGRAHCSCGHPIVDIYFITNRITGKVAPLGSTCIEYFAQAGDIYQGLKVAVKAAETKLAEAKKAAKRAADEIKVNEARLAFEARYDMLLARFKAYRERGEMAPKPLWWAMTSHYRVHRTAPEYQRACDYLKWYAKQTTALQNL